MKTRFVLFAAALLLLSVGGATSLHSQNEATKTSEAERARHGPAINLLRAVNTAEYEYKSKHGGFASKDQLLASEELMKSGMAWAAQNNPQLVNAHLSNGPEILPGWVMRLNLTGMHNTTTSCSRTRRIKTAAMRQ